MMQSIQLDLDLRNGPLLPHDRTIRKSLTPKKGRAARTLSGGPSCSGGVYFTTWDTEGSRTRRHVRLHRPGRNREWRGGSRPPRTVKAYVPISGPETAFPVT